MESSLLHTPLHAWHQNHGGRLVPFGGWDMPVQYTSIVEEHQATRNATGIFDISHMARVHFRGAGSATLLDALLTNEVASLRPGQIRYSLMLNESGGILDDVLVYRNPNPDSVDHMLVVNASNRPKILQWIESHISGFDNVTTEDATPNTAMIAVQGPKSLSVVNSICSIDLNAVKYYNYAESTLLGFDALTSRTGYTGEDGVEIVVDASHATEVWETLHEMTDVAACGLGARDTLRLEAAMPLYGHELSESINPLEVGLRFAVKLDKDQFVGKQALENILKRGLIRSRVGLVLEGRRIAREEFPVLSDGEPVGTVTSGTFSPTLQKSIAMALIETDRLGDGNPSVEVRGTSIPAQVVKLPFYRRAK